MKSRTLSKSEIKELNQKLSGLYGRDILSKKDNVAMVEVEEYEFYKVNNNIDFFVSGELLLPTLKMIIRNNFLRRIKVDIGAVKFVASGADIMRPGIVGIEYGIVKNEIIAVVDEKNNMPFAIGMALENSDEMKAMESGKCIKNLHYVGDKVWKLE